MTCNPMYSAGSKYGCGTLIFLLFLLFRFLVKRLELTPYEVHSHIISSSDLANIPQIFESET